MQNVSCVIYKHCHKLRRFRTHIHAYTQFQLARLVNKHYFYIHQKKKVHTKFQFFHTLFDQPNNQYSYEKRAKRQNNDVLDIAGDIKGTSHLRLYNA